MPSADTVQNTQVASVTKKREYRDDYREKTLYIPGPTEVREDVIEEMAQPMFGHRMDRMTDLYTTIVEDTKEFLGTEHNLEILTASGTEFWEAATLNLVDENILVTTCGSFSERFANVADRLGKNVDRLEYEWGEAVKPEDVRQYLDESDKHYDVVGCVMNESSTGVRNPIEEIGDVVAEYPDTYFVVDAVSSLGGDYVDIDEHNIDVIFASTQKAFAMPPGLAVCAVSDAAYEREVAKDQASWYGGFQRAFDYYDRKGQTHSTPAIPVMLAYRKQMKYMLEEGHKARSQRHAEMAEYTREWAYEHFDMFPEEGYESQTVACIENTQGIDVAATIEEVSETYDFAFSNGYGSQLGEQTFRIGHMGEHTVESIEELTDAIEDVAGL
ncbi:phosphoserine aminotransferase, putative [Halogranum gelatinilyticum]|uniref:Phosphoserine aminotransferase, putative n=1 Tax=Halogranum gelatinilyticum TaxID=660521 RepID=A0A1G9T988_9EURY|nr:phosphoserine aminotransferase, putative [Halogranum gelatinilyticum]